MLNGIYIYRQNKSSTAARLCLVGLGGRMRKCAYKLITSKLFKPPFTDGARNWDNSVGIATSYKLDISGSVSSRGKIFWFFTAPKPARGPPSLLSNGFQELCPFRVKQPGH
jgi:hypothetical protein